MNLKINLMMDRRWFMMIIAFLVVIIIYMLNYGTTNVSLIQVDQYPNCNCSCPNSFSPYYTMSYISLNRSCCYPLDCPEAKNNPKDCKCTYVIECGTYKELVGS